MHAALKEREVETAAVDLAPLVRRMAHHLWSKLPASVELDDLIQWGMMGLLDAARRYQTRRELSSKPTLSSAYAAPCSTGCVNATGFRGAYAPAGDASRA